MGRPKFPRRDANDAIVKEGVTAFIAWCKEHKVNVPIGVNDISPLGGVIDYLVHVGHFTIGFEVKVSEKSHVTKGEKSWVGLRFFVTSSTEVFYILVKYLQFALITKDLAKLVLEETTEGVAKIGKEKENE